MSKQLFILPIEPLSERYTESWYRNLPVEFANAGYDVRVIDGVPLVENDIKVGTFLDINSTCHYKATQLQHVAKLFQDGKVEDGASFFISDLEFWGIEQIRLLATMNGLTIKMYGFLHAASYTKGDAFAVAAPYQQYTELGWIAAMDKVFVGSQYHKDIITTRRLRLISADAMRLTDRIFVTKNPMFPTDYEPFAGVQKEKRMLLTNRFDKEKNPHHTMSLFYRLKELYPEWEFVVTTGRKTFRGNSPDMIEQALRLEKKGVIQIKAGLTKREYHQELARASIVVSHSREESYGLCVAEALIYRCMPLLYNGASHPEFVGGQVTGQGLLFSSVDEKDLSSDFHQAKRLIEEIEEDDTWQRRVPKLDWSGMQNIIKHMR